MIGVMNISPKLLDQETGDGDYTEAGRNDAQCGTGYGVEILKEDVYNAMKN